MFFLKNKNDYRYDISLHSGASASLLSWMIGLMTCVMTLCFAGNVYLSNLTKDWTQKLSHNITIEILPSTQSGIQTNNLIDLLNSYSEVKKVHILSQDELTDLIKPWLDTKNIIDSSLFPTLINVSFQNYASLKEISHIENKITSTFTGLRIDNHDDWLSGVMRFAHTIKISALLLTFAIGALAILAIISTTKSKMTVHKEEVALLHMMGASDLYIIRQFRHYILNNILKGGVVGSGSAFIIFILSATFLSTGQIATPHMPFSMMQLSFISLMPLIIGCGITLWSSHVVAYKELAKLP